MFKNKKITLMAVIGLILTLTIICFSFRMDKDTLKDLITPINKSYKIDNLRKQTMSIGGIKKEITTQTYHSNIGYKIDFDVNLFKADRTNGLDKFTFNSDDEVYFTIEKTTKNDFVENTSSHNLIYKRLGNLLLKIEIYCPEDPDYKDGVYNMILFMIETIENE